MRLGILSDVHANLPALDAVLTTLERLRVDRYVCLGDIVGYGPFPEECLTKVRDLSSDVVAGNHELMVLDNGAWPSIPVTGQETVAWTRSALEASSLRYLSTLPLIARPAPGVLATHGSLLGPEDYVWSAEHARRQLERLEVEHPETTILLVGHTHRAMAYARQRGVQLHGGRGTVTLKRAEPMLLNPGALGQSRQWSARARALILDLDRDRAEFHAVTYDRSIVRSALTRRGLPARAHHRRPGVLDAAGDSLREGRRSLRRWRDSRS